MDFPSGVKKWHFCAFFEGANRYSRAGGHRLRGSEFAPNYAGISLLHNDIRRFFGRFF
jgi:hypothetical protein